MNLGLYIFVAVVLLVVAFTLLGTLVWSKVEPKRKFVAVGNGDVAVAISYDGVEWEPIDDVLGVNTVGTGEAVAWGGGKYVVVGSDGDSEGDNIWWSHDGLIWNAADSTEDDGNGIFGNDANESYGKDVDYADGMWVAVGKDGVDATRCIWWSENGEEWTPGEGDNFGSDSNAYAMVVKYDNGVWIVGGYTNDDISPILWSEDGMEWTSATFPNTNLTPEIFSIAYSDGVWTAVGNIDTNNDGGIWYSEDNGRNWTSAGSGFFGSTVSEADIATFGGKWVTVCQSDDTDKLIYYSSDGKSWVLANYPTADLFNSVKFLNGKFYAFGKKNSEGYIVSSSDGETWSETTGIESSTSLLSSGAYGDNVYVAVGDDDDGIYYSEDGNTWNPVVDQPFGLESTVIDVIYA